MKRRWRRWFLPEVPDLLGMLARQGEVTVEGMQAFAAWAAGEPARQADVRAAEHRADTCRREVLVNLRRAFVTPVGPEDVFELSERLDAVLNDAKDLVREAEVLAIGPDDAVAQMAAEATEGVAALASAFPLLVTNPDAATAAADRAVHHRRRIERIYRTAMRELLEIDNIREVQGRREIYRRASAIGEAVEHTAHRVWYAVVKAV